MALMLNIRINVRDGAEWPLVVRTKMISIIVDPYRDRGKQVSSWRQWGWEVRMVRWRFAFIRADCRQARLSCDVIARCILTIRWSAGWR